ncbi:efflux RND transporter permease subunit [Tropicimonas sediminicola]|uniref:Hydrophobe/amphiphile efflux-1 (HAE1) family protein n=1 Tax=Tropicimonas sediminicola TaxID=1031541 RepID=A0A239FKV4_9RHOB|nr:efflux RND transporter permease subunit [Tropicimonas sediminicola]SNS57387.1 hydrophobe/amphiphile efflux-1 (HAE1) family protein [Tropicimonas sediminicola]
MAHRLIRSGFADLFVSRPILAIVLNLLIAIAGLAALTSVEIREMPDVDQPVVSVRINWDGAAPETVDAEVTSVVEDALAQLDGLKSISSYSGYGSSRLTLELNDGTDVDTAANEAREIISQTERQLPDGIDDPTIAKNDSDSDPIIRLALIGEAPMAEMTELAEGLVTDRLSSIDGIAEIEVMGGQENEFRVEVFLTALVGRGLELDDIGDALSTLRIDTALGDLDSGSQSVLLRSANPEITAETIADLRVNAHTRVGDVALVQLTAKEREIFSRVDGQSSVGMSVVRQSLGNTLAISQGVRAAVAELESDLPDDVRLIVVSDDGVFIEKSIEEVSMTIGMAVLIVVAVIFAFLRSWRAVLIPAVTIPVSLLGSVAAIWLAGFSINTITLLALVLATGMVVDDAIVVVENIVRRRHQGMGARVSAATGTNEVFFAVVSTTATLAAVFVPISFLPGQAGGIFAEFGFVLAFCVMLSSVVALTLAPMLASKLDPGGDKHVTEAEEEARSRRGLSGLYLRIVDGTLAAPAIAIGVAIAFAIVGYGTFTNLSSALTPSEDRGAFFIVGSAPSGASLSFTDAQVSKIEELIEPYVESGEIAAVQSLIGRGGSSGAAVIVRLSDWEERDRTAQELLGELNRLLRNVPGISVFAVSPNSLGIRGAGRGLQFALLGNDYTALAAEGDALIAAMEQDPTFANPRLSYDTTTPLLSVDIDREMATQLGLSPESIATTINTLTQGVVATEVFANGEETDVRMVPGGKPIQDPSDIENVWSLSRDGVFVPLSSVVTLSSSSTASRLSREERSRAVPGEANLGDGVSLGEAAARAEELAAEILSDDARLIFMGEAATLEESQSGTALVFGVALLVVLLVLAAQFESFASAVVIMLTVPFGLGAAVMAIWLTGGTLNYYSQIGLVILIGIMAKNGILIVEFANQLRERGLDIDTAIRDAVRLRVRPVMMTAVSTVVGGLPLVMASGAGAEAREAVGWVIVGGLGFATVFTLFLTPVFYRLLAPLGGEPGAAAQRLELEKGQAAQGA